MPANNDGWPKQGWRTSVFACAWGLVGAFALCVVFLACSCFAPREQREAERCDSDRKMMKGMKANEKARSFKLAEQRSRYGQFQTQPRPYSAEV